MSINLPDCLYQKAFWIVIPILFALVGTIFATVQDGQANNQERITAIEIQVAENNVPTLKEDLKIIDYKLDNLLINSARIEQKVNDLFP